MDSPDRTIVIIGGVAAGASAATRARRVNEHARIILVEKGDYISFANCGLPYYVGEEIRDRSRLLVATPHLLESRYRIEVRTGCEAVGIDRKARRVRLRDRGGDVSEVAYDRLILAMGASPIVPKVPGTDLPHVFTVRDMKDADRLKAVLDRDDAPRRAVLIGAGFIGLEMVEQLVHRGMQVTLVEMADQVLPPLDRELADVLLEELRRNEVVVHVGDGLRSIDAQSVTLASGTVIPADAVVLGVGIRPNVNLARDAGLALGATGGIHINDHAQTSDPNIYAAGDAVEVVHGVTGEMVRMPLAGPANRTGRTAGEHAACDSSAPLGKVFGTAVVRVFGRVAGMTGLSLKEARRRGMAAEAVVVEAAHHATYYPNAQRMLLEVVFDRDSGRLLGAQAVGGDGVDKRLDVLATALHFGASVRQLAELDLTYAPPFGSAKDPIHQAGFTACNVLDGRVAMAAPGCDLERSQVIDVRSAEEVRADPLAGARNIPLEQLRGALDTLDRSAETVVVCRSGLRGYIAARILMQAGFTSVRNLSGGMLLRHHAMAPMAMA